MACSAGCPIICATLALASARRSVPVYVDGVKANEDTTGGPVATAGTGIGSQTPAQAQENHYVGLIDNLRIWSVARARADICADAAPNCR